MNYVYGCETSADIRKLMPGAKVKYLVSIHTAACWVPQAYGLSMETSLDRINTSKKTNNTIRQAFRWHQQEGRRHPLNATLQVTNFLGNGVRQTSDNIVRHKKCFGLYSPLWVQDDKQRSGNPNESLILKSFKYIPYSSLTNNNLLDKSINEIVYTPFTKHKEIQIST